MLKSIIKYRNMVYELAIKDLKTRYRRPVFGFLWTIIIPFCIAVVYKIVFSNFMHAKVENYPFFIYIITALLPWRYFQGSVGESTNSIIGNKNLVKKVSFPKELLPVSIVLANLINFLPAILVIFILLGIFKFGYTIFFLLLPFVILIHTVFILGFSFLFAGLQVIYRDIEYIVEILLLTLFFLTPGIYSLNLVADLNNEYLFKIYMLNPLVGILNLYRLTLLDGFYKTLPQGVNVFNTLIVPLIFSFSMLIIGFYVFKKCELRFSYYIDI